jgi:hypothetical protein
LDCIRREIAVSEFIHWFRQRDGYNSWDMNIGTFLYSFISRIVLKGIASGKVLDGFD